MDGAIFPDVQCGGHSAVGNHIQRFPLSLSEIAGSPPVRIIIRIRGDLHEIERGVRDFENVPHHRHIFFLQADILLSPTAVGLSLVPDHAFESERHERGHLPVEEGARSLELGSDNLVPIEERQVELLPELSRKSLPVDPGLDSGSAPA